MEGEIQREVVELTPLHLVHPWGWVSAERMDVYSLLSPCLCLRYIYLNVEVTEEDLSSAGSLPRMSQWPCLDQVEIRSQELFIVHPHGWQDSRH